MKCNNQKCGIEFKGPGKHCSIACLWAWNRGFPEPQPVPGCRWVELGGHRWTLVDERFHAELTDGVFWSKTRQKNGKLCAHRYVRGIEVKLHVWVMRRVLGAIPEGLVVDHKNGDGLDNRAENLRLATVGENNMNRKSVTVVGFRGVDRAGQGRFRARVRVNGCRRHLGTFPDPLSAARAYDAAARSSGRGFAPMNFPGPGEASALPAFVQVDEVLMTG